MVVSHMGSISSFVTVNKQGLRYDEPKLAFVSLCMPFKGNIVVSRLSDWFAKLITHGWLRSPYIVLATHSIRYRVTSPPCTHIPNDWSPSPQQGSPCAGML